VVLVLEVRFFFWLRVSDEFFVQLFYGNEVGLFWVVRWFCNRVVDLEGV